LIKVDGFGEDEFRESGFKLKFCVVSVDESEVCASSDWLLMGGEGRCYVGTWGASTSGLFVVCVMLVRRRVFLCEDVA